jgi:hypothetical protein
MLFFMCLPFMHYGQVTSNETEAERRDREREKLKEDSTDAAHKTTPHFIFNLDYTSQVVFRGRDFGRQQQGIMPGVSFFTGSGLYFSVNGYHWTGVSVPLAKTDLGIGYEFNSSPWLDLNIAYERWFYGKDTSFLDPAALKNFLQLELSTKFEKVNASFGTYYMWGRDQALVTELTVDALFDMPEFNEKIYWYVDPQVTVFGAAGANVIASPKLKNNRKRVANIREERFDIVDYEFALPLMFQAGNFEFGGAWHYAYPINGDTEDPPLSPYLKGGFNYFTCTVQYAVYLKKPKNK